MKKLSREEKKLLKLFLEMPIPQYVREYNDGCFDLMDCYEIGFVFAHDILRRKKIDTDASPWGDGKSVIFDPDYARLLSDIQRDAFDVTIDDYCRVFLNVLDVFKEHST